MLPTLNQLDTVTNIAASVTTTVAAGLAAVWFYRRRRDKTAATVTHTVHHQLIDSQRRYIRVSIHCANKGAVALYPVWTHGSIQAINPRTIPDRDPVTTEFQWDVLASLDWRHGNDSFVIEPTEEDEWPLEFVLDATVEVIQVHTIVYLAPKKSAADDAPQWPLASDPAKDAMKEEVDGYLETRTNYWDAVTLLDFRPKPRA